MGTNLKNISRFRILEHERKFMDIRHAPNDYDWRLVEQDNAAAAASSSSKKRKQDFNIYDNAIYPLLPPLNLLPVSAKQLDFLKRHCRELHKLALTYVLIVDKSISVIDNGLAFSFFLQGC